MISGHCECGRVRFQVSGSIEDFSHCHCSQCRRLHGAAFATFAAVARENFRCLSGESVVKKYASSARNDRVFCSECGSNLWVDAKDEPELLYLSMGAIEGDPERPQGYHAFAGSKAPWHEIEDDLPQFETWPPE